MPDSGPLSGVEKYHTGTNQARGANTKVGAKVTIRYVRVNSDRLVQ
jgi:hypothetical protein